MFSGLRTWAMRIKILVCKILNKRMFLLVPPLANKLFDAINLFQIKMMMLARSSNYAEMDVSFGTVGDLMVIVQEGFDVTIMCITLVPQGAKNQAAWQKHFKLPVV